MWSYQVENMFLTRQTIPTISMQHRNAYSNQASAEYMTKVLKTALGIQTAPIVANLAPPPILMQIYGPCPFNPNLKIADLNMFSQIVFSPSLAVNQPQPTIELNESKQHQPLGHQNNVQTTPININCKHDQMDHQNVQTTPIKKKSRKNIKAKNQQKAAQKETEYQRMNISFGQTNRRNSKRIVESEKFELLFDIGTPRPHFIIKFKVNQINTLNDLSDQELSEMFELIDNFRNTFNHVLNNDNLIFSYHTGCWANTKYFHAHICVSLNSYITIFQSSNVNLTTSDISSKWSIKPSGHFATTNDLYIENVRNYQKVAEKSSNQYRQAELKQIGKLLTGSRSRRPLDEFKTFNESRIYLSNIEPKIYFQHLTTTGVIRDMCLFAMREQLFDKRKGGGCHICVYLTMNHVGYVHLGGNLFYLLHPKGDDFCTNFKALDNYYIST